MGKNESNTSIGSGVPVEGDFNSDLKGVGGVKTERCIRQNGIGEQPQFKWGRGRGFVGKIAKGV